FTKYHKEVGAKMVEFAGYNMPVQYSGIVDEHLAVRKNIGLFDLSHMGEFEVAGPDALAFLQKTTTNNVAKLDIGQIQYTCMTYENGGIVDDLLVYRIGDNEYFLVVNAANIAKDYKWLSDHLEGNVTLEDRSAEYGLLAIQGPNAEKLMAELTDYDLENMAYYTHATHEVGGEKVLFSRTGYTGEDGFEIYIPPAQCDTVWQAVMEAGKKYDLKLVGLGARDTLRMEMKMALYGNDIDQTTTPIEAGLSFIVDLDTDFIGKDVIAKQKAEKPERRLVCMELTEKAIPRHGFDIVDNGQKIGYVTSGTFSPSLQKPIALGYVPRKKSKSGNTVEIAVRKKTVTAEVVKPPFYKDASHK
ncbi:glycine cleavage system aminomethyltransferase GcvT, partial [candidate division GN15 bacterium]|nr:glycine cleavage system aminomethyltransferase GcvT [candidate division GN15 bacterium]